MGELPFDSDPTNHAGLVNFVNSKLSFDINPEDSAEINFIDKYRKDCTNIGMLFSHHVSGAVIFLLSPAASAINGQNLIIDDGWTL